MTKTVKLGWNEAKQIADILTNTENPDEVYSITEDALAEKWGIDADTFHEIANGIFQMIDFGTSSLTQTAYVGISKDNGVWLAKKEVNLQFAYALQCWYKQFEKQKLEFAIEQLNNAMLKADSKDAIRVCILQIEELKQKLKEYE